MLSLGWSHEAHLNLKCFARAHLSCKVLAVELNLSLNLRLEQTTALCDVIESRVLEAPLFGDTLVPLHHVILGKTLRDKNAVLLKALIFHIFDCGHGS